MFRTACGKASKTSKEGPVPVVLDQRPLKKHKRKKSPTRRRRLEEMVAEEHPQLVPLLDEVGEGVRERALTRAIHYLEQAPERQAIDFNDPNSLRDVLDEAARRHADSPHLLSGTLRSAITGNAFIGHTSRRKTRAGEQREYRYYYDRNLYRGSKTDPAAKWCDRSRWNGPC